MRSELTEPTLEELSAYIDGELDDATREHVEQHLATCADCRTRVDGLRETAYSVRALPMESPPRSFSIPKQRRRSWSWGPVGWLGAAAAAVLVIVVGIHQVYNPTGTTTTAASNAERYAAAAPASRSAQSPGIEDAGAAAQQYLPSVMSLANGASVSDPRNQAFSLGLSTDSAAYSASGTMTVLVRVNGLTAGQVTSVRLLLERNGYAVELPTPSTVSASFESSYSFSKLALSNPVQGTYTLLAIEQLPGGDGATLVARLQVRIQ